MTDFTSNNPHRGSYIVYFNGIEVPTVDVTVDSGVWKIPTATINVPPDRELIRLGREDRIQVEVFYLDLFYKSREDKKPKEPDFRLLFDGEIKRWNYQTTGSNRVMSFYAEAHASTLQQLYPFFVTNTDTLFAATTGADTNTVNINSSQLTFPASLFFQGLNIDGSNRFVAKPYDFIENMFRALIGESESGFYNSSVAKNFFSRWTRLTNFHNRWAPCPLLETDDFSLDDQGVFPILRAVQSNVALKQLMRYGDTIGNGGSFWVYIQAIFQKMYYEFSLNPAPAIVAYDLKTGKILGEPRHKAVGDGGAGADLREPLEPTRLLNHITKPQLLFCVPPMCNVIFPSMITSFGYSEDYAAQNTRMQITPESQLQFFNLARDEASYGTAAAALSAAFPDEAQAALDIKDKNYKYNHQNFLVWPEEFFKGPVVARKSTPDWFMFLYKGYRALDGAADRRKINLEMPYLCKLYAIYEYYRSRASFKSGAVSTPFNPYVVAGYPGVILDQPNTSTHLYGYFINVTHRLSQGEATTTVQYTFGQTMEDFFTAIATARETARNSKGHQAELDYISTLEAEISTMEEVLRSGVQPEEVFTANFDVTQLQTEIDRLTALVAKRKANLAIEVDAGPQHPLPDMRDRFQTKAGAEEFYRELFYRKNRAKKTAGFHWDEYLGVVNPKTKEVTPIEFTVEAQGTTQRVTSNAIASETEDEPMIGFRRSIAAEALTYDRAMETVARPICTLEEYINFHGDRGVRETAIKPFDKRQGKGGTYYQQILDLSPNPDNTDFPDEPAVDAFGNRTSTVPVDTRRDWTRKLKRFRSKVMNDLHPHSA